MKNANEWFAWAAGIVDGEGCIQMARRVRNNSIDFPLMVSVVNTDSRMLDRLLAMFGGTIQVLHRPSKHPKWKASWQWICSHRKAEAALRSILPWLVIKKEQAEVAIAAMREPSLRHRRRTAEELANLEKARKQLQQLKLIVPLEREEQSAQLVEER